MKWVWIVIEETGGSNTGIADSFADALAALSAWQGAPDDPPHRLYQIVPLIPILEW